MKRYILKICLCALVCSLLYIFAGCIGDDIIVGERDAFVTISERTLKFEKIGEIFTVSARITYGKDGDSISWSSSDSSIVECVDGVITTKNYGVAVIRATSQSGAYASCVITVKNPNPTITLSHDSVVFSGQIGEKLNIRAYTEEGHDITSSVTWVSSNLNIVKCFNGTVQTVGYGKCTVRAVLPDGESSTCSITVLDPDAPILELSENDIKFDTAGQEHEISVITAPVSQVSWKSTDESVAVYRDGKIVAVGDGVCAIIATSDAGVKSYCVVTVGTPDMGQTPPADRLNFEVRNLPMKCEFVDRNTGAVQTAVLVTSYNIQYEIDDNDALVLTVTLNCIKLYDKAGAGGLNSIFVTTLLYMDGDKLCETKTYGHIGAMEGDSFSITLNRFAVANKGSVRNFYMKLSSIYIG